MLEQIKQLEKLARCLEPDSTTRQQWLHQVAEYGENFLQNLPSIAPYQRDEGQSLKVYQQGIPEQPISLSQALQVLKESVDSSGATPCSPGYLAYIPGGGVYPSALGDYLAACINRYAGVFFASPGAVRMENVVLRWLAEVVGYPQDTVGNLASGGSIANLIGLVSARESLEISSKNLTRSVIYLSSQTHHCIKKSLHIAGLSECIIRTVALNERYQMIPEKLQEQIEQDRTAGKNPWLIVASAGTTDVGAIDPLEEIAQIAHDYQLWLHIDGAYGGIFALCPEMKESLQGIEKSDSLVIDPHKGLFISFGSGAVLVKDKQSMRQAHSYSAHYMQDTFSAMDEISPSEVSPELTRPFRGLRMWLALQLFGVAPFRAALSEKVWLARYFYEKIQQIPGFEVGPYPELSVVVFRYLPPRGNADIFNQKLIQEVNQAGKIFLSSTRLNGHFVLRLAILCFRTHLDRIDIALELLHDKSQQLLAQL